VDIFLHGNMTNFQAHIINNNIKTKSVLAILDSLSADAVIFVVNEAGKLIGSVTDGDIRRGLLNGKNLDQAIDDFIFRNPRFINKSSYTIQEVIDMRNQKLEVIPILNQAGEISNILNFRLQYSYLPLDAVIMAGGRGSRLRPMTDRTPKPLLQIGDKPIIEHNLIQLQKFGIDDFWVSLNYLGEQLEAFLGDGVKYGTKINYVWENVPLGTIGAVSQISGFQHDHILITNSDILTNLNYEDFYLDFLENDADMSVVTIPYEVNIPYAVLETSSNLVCSFQEKPTYTYYSNGGIYLVKRSALDLIPKDTFFNTTDLMEKLLKEGGKLISYPMRQYWLDIGKPEDFKRAQEDIKHLRLL